MTKPVLTKGGVRLLKRAVAAILARPKTFDMRDWLQHDPTVKPRTKAEEPYCGTVACLAGHIVLAAHGTKAHTVEWVASSAINLLTDDGAAQTAIYERLFYIYGWPAKYADAYEASRSHIGRARVLAKRVDHFLATGE